MNKKKPIGKFNRLGRSLLRLRVADELGVNYDPSMMESRSKRSVEALADFIDDYCDKAVEEAMGEAEERIHDALEAIDKNYRDSLHYRRDDEASGYAHSYAIVKALLKRRRETPNE